MKIVTMSQANRFLQQHKNSLFIGEKGLLRAKALMNFLGNPQNKIKVIHIAGTSGKGSTSYMLSTLLKSQGFKVGLLTSPHLSDIRERIQINNELIKESTFVNTLNSLTKAIERTEQEGFGLPTFFDITTALAYFTFYCQKVDYAVIETGLGGLFDATNTVMRKDKLAIITRLGLDHMQVLGDTVDKIAFQKAGIIPTNGTLITLKQPDPSASHILEEETRKRFSEFLRIEKGKEFSNIKVTDEKTYFDYSFDGLTLKHLEVGLLGDYQAENAALALTALYHLSQRDKFIIDEGALRRKLTLANFLGRFSKIYINNKLFILDGAHNSQKMLNFLQNLRQIYPGKKFDFLISIKKGKEVEKMIKMMIPLSQEIILAQFEKREGFAQASTTAEIRHILANEAFDDIKEFRSLEEAFKYALSTKKEVVVTGSFYLIGDIISLIKNTDLKLSLML